MRGWQRWGVTVVGTLAVGTLVGWAGATVLSPNRALLEVAPYTTIEVVQGELSSILNLSVIAEWTPEPAGTNRSIGVVTALHIESGDEVKQGSPLYDVNLRPVFVAAGDVPAFRRLAQGDAGEDVLQLQRMLLELGYYSGTADGQFGQATAAALRAWQKSVGLPADGIAALGDIVFVPALPARLIFDESLLARDATLVGTEAVLQSLPNAPKFRMSVTASQAAAIPAGTLVRLHLGDHDWEAITDSPSINEGSGQLEIALKSKNELEICAEACGEIPATAPSSLSATIEIVPLIRGLVVPSAAIASLADGSIVLVDKKGVSYPVSVLGQAHGMSAIEGVRAGLSVRVPGRVE